MTLTIGDTTMISDQTAHTARQAPGSKHLWQVSWLPGRTVDRNSAITAMVLADQAGIPDLNQRHRLWPHIEGWAAELGLTGSDAVNRVSQPAAPGQQHDREREPPDPRGGTMTAQPCQHRDREPGPAAPPRRISGPPPGDDIAAGIASRAGGDLHGGRLAYSADEAARLTGPSRDLLYEELRCCNLAYVKVRRRCLITRQHLQQFLGIAS